LRQGDIVFPGIRLDRPLSQKTLLRVLDRMGRGNLTNHGMRSCFRDWAAERTNFPSELAEAALAHSTGDDTERAYRRGDALDKRRQLMAAWADFCGQLPPADTDNVIQMRGLHQVPG
jgi:integrase